MIAQKSHTAIVIILDGCNVKWLDKTHLPNIRKIADGGSSTMRCKSVCPTATFTGHCSLITGQYPDVHGIVGNCFYDKEGGKVVDFDYHDVNVFVQATTIYEQIDGLTAAVGEPITRGADIIIPKDEIQMKPLWEQNRYCADMALKVMAEHSPRFIAINFTGIDGIAESYGPDSEEILEAMKDVDKLIGEIKAFLDERHMDYLLLITADHGMTFVEKNINLPDLLKGLKVKVFPSHRFAHLYVDRDKVDRTRDVLKADGRFELILSREQSKNIRLLNPRVGDLMVAAKEGYELSEKKLNGSHGGITDDEMYVPFIVSRPEYYDIIEKASITDVPRVILRYLNEKEAEEIVRKTLKNVDPAHGWDHVERVLNMATKLAISQHAQLEIVRLSCIFHDSQRGEVIENHAWKGAELAEEFLKSKNYAEYQVRKVTDAIIQHHAESGSIDSLEARILWDADKLDALGVVGLARCLQEAGYKKQSLKDAIAHFESDTENFKSVMHFEETLKIAEQETQMAKAFVNRLKRC